MGKSTINGPFSIAMLVHQRVITFFPGNVRIAKPRQKKKGLAAGIGFELTTSKFGKQSEPSSYSRYIVYIVDSVPIKSG